MLRKLMKILFPGLFPDNSREDVKRRLKLVLAHDRADLPPQMLKRLQQEILEVISRYLEIDTDGLEFSLDNDQRTTALTANFPIRRIKVDVPEESEGGDSGDLLLDETAIPDPNATASPPRKSSQPIPSYSGSLPADTPLPALSRSGPGTPESEAPPLPPGILPQPNLDGSIDPVSPDPRLDLADPPQEEQ